MLRSRRRLGRSLAVLLVLLVGPSLSGCAEVLQTLQQSNLPTARLAGARITGFGLDHVMLGFDLEIQNPSGVPLPLLDLGYSLASGGKAFLSGNSDVSGTVPARGRRVVELPLRVDLLETVRALSGVRPGQVLPYRAAMEIGVDAPGVGRLALPLSHDGEMPVPAVPDVKLGSIQWDELSLTRVGGTAKLQIGNTNDFALDLQNLSMDLKLGGRDVGQVAAQPTGSLQPGASTTLEIPLGFTPLELGTSLVNMLRGESGNYGIDGNLAVDTRFGTIQLPYSNSGQVPFFR